MNIVIQYNQKSLVVGAVLTLIIVGGFVWFSRMESTREQPTQTQSPVAATAAPVNDGIDVDASRLPESNDGTITFSIALNTHSGDLSTYNAVTNVLFRSANGSITLPIKVGGDRETHHRTIEVAFKNLVFPGTLLINNLGSIKERSFEFN